MKELNKRELEMAAANAIISPVSLVTVSRVRYFGRPCDIAPTTYTSLLWSPSPLLSAWLPCFPLLFKRLD